MTAVLTLRVYTGTNAGTQSAAQAAIALLPTDSASSTPAAVAKGAYSYEKWMRILIDDPDGDSFTNFWIERAGDLPDGVTIRFGVTDTPATPRNTVSLVATTTMADGRRYIFDTNAYDTADQTTRYFVVQAQVAASAASGAIDQQVFTTGYAQN